MRWFFGVALILLIALVLQSGLLAFAMYVLLIMMVTSRLLARAWIGNLTATRKCPRLIAEIGDKVKVRVTVRNNGRIPVPWVLLEDIRTDRREELRFRNTHRLVWEHIVREFEVVPVDGLPANVQLLRRRAGSTALP